MIIAQINNYTGFEWDKGNLNKNWRKHRVTEKECEEAFFHKPVFVYEDKKHSQDESRYFLLGRTDCRRLLFVAFTVRNQLARVISARPMSKKERQFYVKKIKKNSPV